MTDQEYVRSRYPNARAVYSNGNADGLPQGFKIYQDTVRWLALSATLDSEAAAWAAAARAVKGRES